MYSWQPTLGITGDPRPEHYQQDQTPPGWSECLALGTETVRRSPKQGFISPTCSFVGMQDGTKTTSTEPVY